MPTASTRRLALASLLLLLPVLAVAAPPKGKRSKRPSPTHIVIVETAFETGGQGGTLLAGVPVAAAKKAETLKGKIKVTTVGPVEVTGTVDGAALGWRVARDTELRTADGKRVLGTAGAGALVRVVGKGAKGMRLVESAGDVKVRGQIAAAELTLEPADHVMKYAWNVETDKPARLWAGADLKGAPMVELPAGVHLDYYEKMGDVAHVRTVGAIEIDGWTPVSNLKDRDAPASPPPDPNLIAPTHEAFVDMTIYADPAAKKKLGTLRGGALVEVNPRATRDAKEAEQAGTVKVTTPPPVVVEGWVRSAELRELSKKAMSQ